MDLFRAMRPRQWIKNLLLYAGLLFTVGREPFLPGFLLASLGFVLFCALSSAAYLLNDLRDQDQDRRHPTKRHRPIAAGRLAASNALLAAIALTVVGLVASFRAGWLFGLIALAYFVVTLAYSLGLKHVVLLDVLALAAGYVFRAVAGAAILRVPASFWLALCTLLLALFLALCKRRGEMTGVMNPGSRLVLDDYTLPLLDQLISVSTASSVVAYALYTYFTPTTLPAAFPWQFRDHLLAFTIPFVVYGVFRYLYLVYRRSLGDAPEEIFLRDRPLQINTLLWLAACALAVLSGGRFGP